MASVNAEQDFSGWLPIRAWCRKTSSASPSLPICDSATAVRTLPSPRSACQSLWVKSGAE